MLKKYFEEYVQTVYHKEISGEQLRQVKMAWYGGCIAVLMMVELTQEIQALIDECKEFNVALAEEPVRKEGQE